MTMKRQHQTTLENIIYALIWLVAFAIPVLAYNADEGIRWLEVKRFWYNLIPFFTLFVVNNYVFIPCFLLKKKHSIYFVSLLAWMLLSFTVLPLMTGRGAPKSFPGTHLSSPSPARNTPPPPPPGLHKEMRPPHPDAERPPRIVPIKWKMKLNDWLLAMLVVGFNIAIRLLFKSIRDARRLDELESQNLRTELNYLKAQINPHFFMNTLNNIHALVDIDGDKAKLMIVELSRLMRYVLYEADKPLVSLSKEVEFIKNYIALMRIRYSNEVIVSTTYPEALPEVQVPPLLLITLIENAFKHGISINANSYIYTSLFMKDARLMYSVRNSISDVAPSTTGMGLENLRKRLNLLFGQDHYTLESYKVENEFVANLIIPINHED